IKSSIRGLIGKWSIFLQHMLPCQGELAAQGTEGYLHYSVLKDNSFIKPQRKGVARVNAEIFVL
ncbi:MAG TPA: hypothetical protein DCO78_11120, partial [Chitinophagaceae bacterium]|nr:hypothetical protein [Chitinophagaceae bacterium]